MTEQEQKAFDQMREALSDWMNWTPEYGIEALRNVEDNARAALTAANAVQPQFMGFDVVLDPTMKPNEMELVQPQAQGEADRKAIMILRENGAPHTNATLVRIAHEIAALYPQATEPAGWKLVPVEPTQEILRAFQDQMMHEFGMKTTAGYHGRAYRAMLAAAPEAP